MYSCSQQQIRAARRKLPLSQRLNIEKTNLKRNTKEAKKELTFSGWDFAAYIGALLGPVAALVLAHLYSYAPVLKGLEGLHGLQTDTSVITLAYLLIASFIGYFSVNFIHHVIQKKVGSGVNPCLAVVWTVGGTWVLLGITLLEVIIQAFAPEYSHLLSNNAHWLSSVMLKAHSVIACVGYAIVIPYFLQTLEVRIYKALDKISSKLAFITYAIMFAMNYYLFFDNVLVCLLIGLAAAYTCKDWRMSVSSGTALNAMLVLFPFFCLIAPGMELYILIGGPIVIKFVFGIAEIFEHALFGELPV